MPRQDPQYRANPERAIYICTQLTESLLADVSPKILELRKDPNEPITVFINSPGGSIRTLDVLDGLLRSRDADGRSSRLITVALGDANSAAATLLALGDYAIAYPHSRMHFHGSRLAMVEELTAEKASDRAGRLANLNRSIAMRLAKVVLKRLVLRYVQLQPEFETSQQRLKQKTRQPIICFVDCMKQRISQSGDRLLDRTIQHMGRLAHVSDTLSKAGLKDSDSRLIADTKVFQAILKFEIREHRHEDWCLDENGVQEILSDYFLLRDYIFGEHIRHLDGVIERFGPSFLNEEQFNDYTQKNAVSPDEARKWLATIVETDVREFWYFTVCLCRLMQEGENSLVANDAYWLGVVDEVLGTELHGARRLVEDDLPVAPSDHSESTA
jgi:ATP-dependent protease ClpP protease subunit